MPRNSKISTVVNTIDSPNKDFERINLNIVTLTISACRYFESFNKAELSIKFGTDEEIIALNHEFRGKNKSTNILSFPSNESKFHPTITIWDTYIGDQILNMHVIEQEAKEQGKPLLHHYTHMIIHSTLHLLGYDHQDEREAEEMEALETKILNTLNIPSPY